LGYARVYASLTRCALHRRWRSYLVFLLASEAHRNRTLAMDAGLPRRNLPVTRGLTRDEAAAYCGVSPKTFDLDWKPMLHALRVGAGKKRTVYDRCEIDAIWNRLSGIANDIGDRHLPVSVADPSLEAVKRLLSERGIR
jgi:hypothetical protein